MFDINEVNNERSTIIIKRLLSEHVAPYRKRIFIAIFFMVIAALCSALIVWLTKPVIDKVLIEHNSSTLVFITIAIICIYAVKGVSEFFQNYMIKFIGQQIVTDLQIKMYKHLLESDYLVIGSLASGRIISSFTSDIILMRSAVSNTLVGCAKHLLSVIFLVGIMFFLDVYLSLAVFLVFPLVLYPIQRLGRKMRLVVHNSQEELGNFTAKLDESFNAIKVIKSFCMEDYEFNQAKKIIDRILIFYKKAARLDSITSPLMEILSGLTIVGLIWYGNQSITNGTMTTGTIFTFIMAFVSAYRPYKSLVSLNVSFQEGVAAARRVFHILDLVPTVTDEQAKKNANFSVPSIRYKNINLAFANSKILNNFNLSVEGGKTYALVGGSGSGKTSVVNLIIRLFDPTAGQIFIDDIEIKELPIKNLRSQIAFVTQETLLFDASVAKNIAYSDGEEQIDLERVKEAAKAANADEFIESLQNGYDTILGTKGYSLSGGQRQRLSIARAFYKNAPILVLDEATSSLDSRSESAIIQALQKLRAGKTTLIITHRLHSIVHADEIIVMKQGQVIEKGSHENLLLKKGEYYELYNKELQVGEKNI